jgi:hypothetical protein
LVEDKQDFIRVLQPFLCAIIEHWPSRSFKA